MGYRKPPKRTQFPKGRSGNPNGRPNGSKIIKDVIYQTLSQRLNVTVNGRHKRITKREAIIQQLFKKAALGDLAYIKLLLQLSQGAGIDIPEKRLSPSRGARRA